MRIFLDSAYTACVFWLGAATMVAAYTAIACFLFAALVFCVLGEFHRKLK